MRLVTMTVRVDADLLDKLRDFRRLAGLSSIPDASEVQFALNFGLAHEVSVVRRLVEFAKEKATQ